MAIAALKGDEKLAALAEGFDVYPNQITQRKTQLLESAVGVFATVAEKQSAGHDLKDLHAKAARDDAGRYVSGRTSCSGYFGATPIYPC